MSTPPGDNAFLYELDLEVREEVTLAENVDSAQEAVEAPVEEWLSDPADDQRYEVSLHVLLGAVEALEDAPGPSVAAPDDLERGQK